jgi:aryl-alcohol dehydrogenase-like predicted oxidoreductase
MQDQYNLLKREEEREMLPMCADMGVGVVPYSPQGKGRLTRPWGQQTARAAVDQVARSFDSPADQPIVEAVEAIAAERGVSMAQVALAWVLSKPVVTAPIVGATKPHHLVDAVAAVNLELTDEEIHRLENPYVPQEPYWW